MNTNNDDIFDPTHIPDPVAERAKKYAVEVTNPEKPRFPWLSKLMVAVAIVFLVAGTFGIVVGTINSIQLSHQTDIVKRQQVCINEVLKVLTAEQKARSDISNDDRRVMRNLVTDISRAKNPGDVSKALRKFNIDSAKNDKRRADHPLPVVDENVCNFQSVQDSPLPSDSVPPIVKSKPKGGGAKATKPGVNNPKVTQGNAPPSNHPKNTRKPSPRKSNPTTPPNIVGPIVSNVCSIITPLPLLPPVPGLC